MAKQTARLAMWYASTVELQQFPRAFLKDAECGPSRLPKCGERDRPERKVVADIYAGLGNARAGEKAADNYISVAEGS